MKPLRKAIFLDKDGALIPDIPYNINPELITLSKHAVIGLKRLAEAGFQLFLVSNQAGIAHSYFHEHALFFVEWKIRMLLQTEGLSLNGFYYCPHHPNGVVEAYRIICNCRKPAPGLILKAAKEHQIDLPRSWMIGDILHDVEAGNRAGCRTVLIDNGNETKWEMNHLRKPDYIVSDINQAADYILKL